MPGTTRYSATFDRPYEEDEEDELPAVPPLTRRSRSQSWQAPSSNSRPYTPLGGCRLGSHARSSSTDNGPQGKGADGAENIPTRTAGKVSVKVAHNPFQFVKIASCPLSRKAEELLKKTQEKKKPEVLKEEEEEWQTNLDSWKNRRRKMSEHTIRRQEELKQLEIEEQSLVLPKKTKTFSEMLEQRAHRGRALSMSFFPNPLEMEDWNFDNLNKDFRERISNGTQLLSGGSEESSNMNSEDESDTFQKKEKNPDINNLQYKSAEKKSRRTGNLHMFGNSCGLNNGTFPCEKSNGNGSDFQTSEHDMNGETTPHKDESSLNGMFIDSGLDSLSSSHRAGDIPDSGSDFSQDSGSSLDCDSPNVTGMLTTGMELLEEFSSKESSSTNGITFLKEKLEGMELCLKLNIGDSKLQQFGFTVNGGKDKGLPVTVASVLSGSVCDAEGLKIDDQILAINKEDVSSLNHSAVISALKQAAENRQLELLLWRPGNTAVDKPNRNGTLVPVSTENDVKPLILEESAKSPLSNPANLDISNKELAIKEISVDERATVKELSSKYNKKTVPLKQKDTNRKKPAPAKPSNQESTENTKKGKDGTDELSPICVVGMEKSVDTVNNGTDQSDNSSAVSNSKIPVAEKSTKYVKKEISKTTPEPKKSKCNTTDKSPENLSNLAKAVEMTSKDSSLNIIFQSHPVLADKDLQNPVQTETKPNSSVSPTMKSAVADRSAIKAKEESKIPSKTIEHKLNENSSFNDTEITPVEKVAEEMERLILEQLEQEEKLKETNAMESHALQIGETVEPDHISNAMDTPPRQLEPPKEKPPPPPLHSTTNNSEMDSSLTRVNSTKRIKKEIQKRRSDFLGIDNSEEDEPSFPEPPGLESILKAECEKEKKVRQMLSNQSTSQHESSIDEEDIAQKEREIIENLETEERKKMETQLSIDINSLHLENSSIEEERIRKLKEERQRMEEERFLKEEQRIRLEEERQLRDREQQIRKQEDPKLFVVPSTLSLKSHIVVDATSVTAESKQLPHNDDSFCQKSGSHSFPVNTFSSTTNKCIGNKESQSFQPDSLRKETTGLSCKGVKIDSKIANSVVVSGANQSDNNCNKQLPPRQIVSSKVKTTKKKIKNIEAKMTQNNCSNSSATDGKSMMECNEKHNIMQPPHTLLENNSKDVNQNVSSALNLNKITKLEVCSNNSFQLREPSMCSQEGKVVQADDSNSVCKGKGNLVKVRRKKNSSTSLMSSKEQDVERSISINHGQNKESPSHNFIGSAKIVSKNNANLEAHLEKTNDSQVNSIKSGKISGSNTSDYSVINASEKVIQGGDTLDSTTSSPSVAESSTNPESSTSVSLLSSTSSGISCSQNGDGKNLNSSCVFPSTVDVSIAQRENVNTAPPKPLKKKEAIRRERERLRQEQEALQREREDHRLQLFLEQERLKKDIPKAHAVSSDHLAKSSLASTAVPQSRVSPNDQWTQQKKVLSVKKQIDSPSESRYNQNHWLIQEAEMRRISEQNERQRLHNPHDSRQVPQNQMQYLPSQLGDESHCGSHIAVQRQTVIPPVCPSLKQSNYPVSTQVHSPEQMWNYGQPTHANSQSRKCSASNSAHTVIDKIQSSVPYSRKARMETSVQPPTKPSRVLPVDRQDQMLSVSGRKRCSHCGEELGRGAAMIIESLQLYYHIHCFRCCVCQAQLGNGSCGTDVRVRNNKLHCHNCYSNDEAGLKFSQV